MSQAEELLNGLPGGEIAVYTANPETEPHIVINADRTITVPPELKKIAVQYDHNIKTVTFDCPRYWDGHDMSKMEIRIVCERADHITVEPDVVSAISVDDNIMQFQWTITRKVTMVAGSIKIQVCIRNINDETIEENHWNSEVNEEMVISKSLNCGSEIIIDSHPKRMIILTDRVTGLDYELYVSDGKLMMSERSE